MNTQTTDSKKKGMGCFGVGFSLIIILLVLLSLVGFSGAIYEARVATAVSNQYPAPGQIVAVNGRNMHIHCTGTGNPTIILDAGQGGWSSDWGDIIPELSANNRVCAYDRAGYGWSDPVDNGHSPQDAADDLADLLAAAKIEPPYLLVGFSHAGLADRLFAAQHAKQMAGLVLIDPATEFDNEIMSPELMQQQQAAVGMFKGFTLMSKIGLLRLIGTENMAGNAPFIGTDHADPDLYYAFITAPQWWQTSEQEFQSSLNDDNLAMVRYQGQIPNIPLVIIGSDILDTTGNAAMDDLQTARHEKLSALANQAAQGEFIIAEGSSHDIVSDSPNLIIAAIESIAANQ